MRLDHLRLPCHKFNSPDSRKSNPKTFDVDCYSYKFVNVVCFGFAHMESVFFLLRGAVFWHTSRRWSFSRRCKYSGQDRLGRGKKVLNDCEYILEAIDEKRKDVGKFPWLLGYCVSI